jgi:hypothetical protein
MTPFRLLFWFTPLWLDLLGALTAWSPRRRFICCAASFRAKSCSMALFSRF